MPNMKRVERRVIHILVESARGPRMHLIDAAEMRIKITLELISK